MCGLIGVYVVLRGMSYIGHGLSHAIFGGAVASYILGINVFIGAGAWGLVAALFINRVARRRSIGADAAIGAITSAAFAIGIILISMQGTFVVNFEALLWGNVLGVAPLDVVVVVLVARRGGVVRLLRVPAAAVLDVRSGGRRGLRACAPGASI